MEDSEKLDMLLKSVDTMQQSQKVMSDNFEQLKKEVGAGQEETTHLIVQRMQRANLPPKG